MRRAFSSPERESQERATKKARVERQQRATTMLDISRGLENVADVPKLYKALHLCKDTPAVVLLHLRSCLKPQRHAAL